MQNDVLNHPKQGVARFFGPVNICFFGFEFAIFLFHAIGFASGNVHGVDGDSFGCLRGEGIFKNHDGLGLGDCFDCEAAFIDSGWLARIAGERL